MYRKYFVPALGIAAGIVGFIITREKALDGLETVEHFFDKQRQQNEPEPEHDVVQGEVISSN